VRIKGSAYYLSNPRTGRLTSVHVHGNRDIPLGTLRAIVIEQAGLKDCDGKHENWQAVAALFAPVKLLCGGTPKQVSKVPEGHPFTEVRALYSY